jgi:hypothetical protein
MTPRFLGDLRAVGRDDEAREQRRLPRRGDRLPEESAPSFRRFLPGSPLEPPRAGMTPKAYGALAIRYTVTQRRSAADFRAASMTRIVLSPSQPSQAGLASPRMHAMKCFASSTYISLSWPPDG